jgi:hypothetical protein
MVSAFLAGDFSGFFYVERIHKTPLLARTLYVKAVF